MGRAQGSQQFTPTVPGKAPGAKHHLGLSQLEALVVLRTHKDQCADQSQAPIPAIPEDEALSAIGKCVDRCSPEDHPCMQDCYEYAANPVSILPEDGKGGAADPTPERDADVPLATETHTTETAATVTTAVATSSETSTVVRSSATTVGTATPTSHSHASASASANAADTVSFAMAGLGMAGMVAAFAL